MALDRVFATPTITVDQEKYDKLIQKENNINKIIELLKNNKITPKKEINDYWSHSGE